MLASPLRDLANTILTPHMLGHTVEGHAVLPGVAAQGRDDDLVSLFRWHAVAAHRGAVRHPLRHALRAVRSPDPARSLAPAARPATPHLAGAPAGLPRSRVSLCAAIAFCRLCKLLSLRTNKDCSSRYGCREADRGAPVPENPRGERRASQCAGHELARGAKGSRADTKAACRPRRRLQRLYR
jgi:hypothetical protein